MKRMLITVLLLLLTLTAFPVAYDEWEIVDPGSGDTTLKAARAGSRVCLKVFVFKPSNACTILFKSGGGTEVFGEVPFTGSDGWDRGYWKQPINIFSEAGESLVLNCSADPGADFMYYVEYVKA